MLLHVRKEEGFVRTQTLSQTIAVTSADCLSATETAVKWDGWYKMVCVRGLAKARLFLHNFCKHTGEYNPNMILEQLNHIILPLTLNRMEVNQ